MKPLLTLLGVVLLIVAGVAGLVLLAGGAWMGRR